MRRSICFDLDGTILNVRDRYYELYRAAVVRRDRIPLSRGHYMRCLRKGMKHWEMFERWNDRAGYESYLKYRNARIEEEQYLLMDSPVGGMKKVLKHLRDGFRLILLSNRDRLEALTREMERFRMAEYFEDFCAAGLDRGAEGKRAALRNRRCHAVVGDTETDVETGKHLSAMTIAVSWGLRHGDFLAAWDPDCVVRKPADLISLIQEAL